VELCCESAGVVPMQFGPLREQIEIARQAFEADDGA
jgi:hypothetical protein